VLGPAFAGGGVVVWGEQTRGGRITVNVADGGRVRGIGGAYFPSATRHDLLADGDDVALVSFNPRGVAVTSLSVSGKRPSVQFGVVGGVASDLSSAPGGGRVALAAGTVGVRRADGKLALYDTARGTRRIGLPGRGEVLLAGDLLLDRTPAGQVRLSDRTTARGRYVPEVAPDMRAVGLQPDGTALFTSPGVQAAVTTRDAKAARPLDVPSIGLEEQRRVLAGGRVATLLQTGLDVTGIDGVPVARIATPRAQPPLAFDGQRAAWSIRPCAVASVVTWFVGEPVPPTPAADCRPATPRIERIRRAALRITLRCPAAATQGCAMFTTVRVRAAGRTIRVRGRAKVTLMPGEALLQLWRPARSDGGT
jgi:hypothetical protein